MEIRPVRKIFKIKETSKLKDFSSRLKTFCNMKKIANANKKYNNKLLLIGSFYIFEKKCFLQTGQSTFLKFLLRKNIHRIFI